MYNIVLYVDAYTIILKHFFGIVYTEWFVSHLKLDV